MTKPSRLYFAVFTFVGYMTSALSSVEPESTDKPDKKRERQGILASATDFSQPPQLPRLDRPTEAEIRKSIDRGVRFLLEVQNKNGSWGSATKTKGLNIYAPVPGAHDAFRTGVTALCISALIEVAPDNPQAIKAVDRGEAWLFENLGSLRRATGDAIYNVWGHAYSIQALVRLSNHRSGDEAKLKKIEKLIRQQFDMLSRYESVDGGWGYYDFRYQARKPTSSSISFVNGAGLVAFAEAKAIGIDPPEKIIRRAIAATGRQQKKDFSYLYGEYLKD